MLKASDQGRVSSAAWAIGELALYYKQNDPMYLATHVDFLELVGHVRELVNHPNDMVRRQANAAVMKFEGPSFGMGGSGSQAA